MHYKTGIPKSLAEILLIDMLEFPIWECALDVIMDEQQDDTWQRPVISTTNVSLPMINPTILLKVKGYEYYALGEYNNLQEELSGFSIWNDDHWCFPEEIKEIKIPLVYISIPEINHESDIEFICFDLENDTAIKRSNQK